MQFQRRGMESQKCLRAALCYTLGTVTTTPTARSFASPRESISPGTASYAGNILRLISLARLMIVFVKYEDSFHYKSLFPSC